MCRTLQDANTLVAHRSPLGRAYVPLASDCGVYQAARDLGVDALAAAAAASMVQRVHRGVCAHHAMHGVFPGTNHTVPFLMAWGASRCSFVDGPCFHAANLPIPWPEPATWALITYVVCVHIAVKAVGSVRPYEDYTMSALMQHTVGMTLCEEDALTAELWVLSVLDWTLLQMLTLDSDGDSSDGDSSDGDSSDGDSSDGYDADVEM